MTFLTPSPVSPSNSPESVDFPKVKDLVNKGSIKNSLRLMGYSKIRKIVETGQGILFEAEKKGKVVVIKQASKDTDFCQVQPGDAIVKEAFILKKVCSLLPQNYVAGYLDFFQTERDNFLVMEHGGADMFEFVVNAHAKIDAGQISVKRWRKYVKFMMWQVCMCVYWLHSDDVRCCHLDISLENMLVSNCNWVRGPGKEFSLGKDLSVQLCDFGLAEMFKDKNFSCEKFCGKLKYVPPQIAENIHYQANKADIWSLGVSLFCMAFGAMPYSTPDHTKDKNYLRLVQGNLRRLIEKWGYRKMVSKEMLHLMENMLLYDEEKRYDIKQVISHPWFSYYYKEYKIFM